MTVTVATSLRPCNNLDFTGFTGTLAGSQTLSPYGNVTLGSGMTWSFTGILGIFSTVSTNWTSNGITMTSPITMNGSSSNAIVLQDDMVITGRLTLMVGTLDMNGNNLSCGGFTSSSNSNVKVLTMSGGVMTITGTGTWVTSGTQTNLTLNTSGESIVCSGTAMQVRTTSGQSIGANITFSGSGTGSFYTGTGVWGNCYVTGSLTFSVDVNAQLNNLDFTGFTGTWSGSTNFKIAGDLILASGMTVTSTGTITNNKNGAIQLKCSGKSLTCSLSITGTSSVTVDLLDDFSMDSAYTLAITSGTFDTNNYNVTAGIIQSANSNTRTFDLGTSTITLTGTGTVWNFATSTNLTMNASSSTIIMTNTSASSVQFSGGAKTYNIVEWDRGASTGNNIITQSNTFTTFEDNGTAGHSITFPAGATQTVTNFNVSGSAGNLITINTTSSSATHALVKTGGGVIECDYLNIQHSIATPYNTWYAGVNSVNNQSVVSAGSGWNFTTRDIAEGAFNQFI